jgi:hypothetical protein
MKEHQSALIVSSWQGDSWVLPWSHFASARLAEGDGRLEIAFTTCLIIVSGGNLHGLLNDIAAFRVGCLRELPAAYRKKSGEGEPFIARIEVRSVGDTVPCTKRESS